MREKSKLLKSFFKIILLQLLIFGSFQIDVAAVEERKLTNEEYKIKIEKLNWHNYANPKEHTIKLEEADAKIPILESEYYLKGHKDINQQAWWSLGKPTDSDDILYVYGPAYQYSLAFREEGHVKIDDWKSVNAENLMKEMRTNAKNNAEIFKKQGLGYIKKMDWVFKPTFDEDQNLVNYSYKISWSDNTETIEAKGLVLGRKGHIDLTVMVAVDSDTNFDITKEIQEEISNSIIFNDGSRYTDYKSGDKIAAVGIGGLVAGTLGVKALAKVGVFAKLLPLLLKFGWILLIPLVFVGKLFGKKNQPRRSSKRKK